MWILVFVVLVVGLLLGYLYGKKLVTAAEADTAKAKAELADLKARIFAASKAAKL
jgi:hypothetical protein